MRPSPARPPTPSHSLARLAVELSRDGDLAYVSTCFSTSATFSRLRPVSDPTLTVLPRCFGHEIAWLVLLYFSVSLCLYSFNCAALVPTIARLSFMTGRPLSQSRLLPAARCVAFLSFLSASDAQHKLEPTAAP
eukprot:603003-Pleurochrysis_carterae.AAC.1